MIGALSGRLEGFVCVVLLTRRCPYIVLTGPRRSAAIHRHEPGLRGARRASSSMLGKHRGERVGGGTFGIWVSEHAAKLKPMGVTSLLSCGRAR